MAMNLRRGIVRFLFANLLLLVIKPCIILFGWYIIAYATLHTPLILASLKGCVAIFVTVSLILIDLGNSILMFRSLTHFTHLFYFFLRNLVVLRYSKVTTISE